MADGSKVDAQLALSQTPRKGKVRYTKKDCILYALGLGSKGVEEHRYIFELHPDFVPLPTMPVVWNANPHDVKIFGGAPKKNKSKSKDKAKSGEPEWGMLGPGIPKFNFALLLHGEQYVELAQPGGLPTSGEFETVSRPIGVHDKGKGLLFEAETVYKDPNSGKDICRTVSASYVRSLTGFKSAGETYSKIFKMPERAPDKVLEVETSPYQAELYRVNGDYNPLHIDHKLAASVGFKAPILHGLCTFGMAAKAVLKAFADGDPKRFRAIKVRFASPVYPGDTLVVKMWKDSEKHGDFERILFETKVKASNTTVHSSAYVDLFTNTSKM